MCAEAASSKKYTSLAACDDHVSVFLTRLLMTVLSGRTHRAVSPPPSALWNLQHEPLCEQKVVKRSKLTHVCFNKQVWP